ncbi:hypothetical protein Tco_0233877 [Tanacetum coccineum]
MEAAKYSSFRLAVSVLKITDITRAQQKALDDDLVAPANRLKIEKCNIRLSSNLNSKEPTLQVVLDALKLTSFYKAFESTTDVPEIYMQEFWVTSSRHHSLLRFKMNGKIHTVNVCNFRDMLQICPKLLGQKFKDPHFEEEIISFIRDLGHTSEINVLSDVNIYGVILPQYLTNQAMLESEAYKTYHEYATGEKIPKPKYVKNKADPESSPKKKSAQASKGKRIKNSTKVAKLVKKKQPATTDKGDDDEVNVSEEDDNKNDDNADNEDDDDQDDDNEQTKLDNDDDDLVHPKLSTFDEKERQDEEDKEEEWSDDEAYDDETQGVNVEGKELDEEETNEEDEQSSSVSSGFISNKLNPNPDTGIDSILNLNTDSTSLVDVPVSTNVEMPPSSVTPLPLPPIPFIQPQQQTLFEDRVKALEDNFLEFQQINQFAAAVSSIPSIVDTYLTNKMNEAVKIAVQLQSDRLRDEAQAENEDFINTLMKI